MLSFAVGRLVQPVHRVRRTVLILPSMGVVVGPAAGAPPRRRGSPMTTPGEHRIEGMLAAILDVAG